MKRIRSLVAWVQARPRFIVEIAVLVLAAVHAASLAWLCDDAFISFRYARNLADGHGLVFNPGERIEGMTNWLWTVMLAAGMKLGLQPESVSLVVGIAAYIASVGLLLWSERRFLERIGMVGRWFVPVAGLWAAADRDWATYATSGLETSLFTLVSLGGVLFLLMPHHRSWRTCGLAGALFALAAMIRPEGAGVAGLALVAFLLRADRSSRSRLAPLVAYLVCLVLPLVCFAGFRLMYYGALVPNTYYAKSGGLSWWSQGLTYVVLSARRHVGVLVVGMGALGLVVWRRNGKEDRDHLSTPWRDVLVMATIAAGYTAYVAKVGGDFMFGRFLVPVTPFLFLGVSLLLQAGATKRVAVPAQAAVLGAALGLFLTPCPVGVNVYSHHGIVDERAFYRPELINEFDQRGERLRVLTTGLQVRAAMYGAGARVAYRAQYPVVVEAQTGLTDAYVAHLPLQGRRRVGHEKSAPPEYLVLTRKVNLTTEIVPSSQAGLDKFIPLVVIDAGGFWIRLLYWDKGLVAALAERGARVLAFPQMLDDVIARLPTMAAYEVRREWARYDHFYFANNQDPVRRAAFARRLTELGLQLLDDDSVQSQR